MKVAELIPIPTSKITLGILEVGSFSNGLHCYSLTDPDGKILFIGATKHLNSITKLHSDKFAKSKGIEGKINCYFIAGSGEEEFLKIEKNWMDQHFELKGKLPSCNMPVHI